MNLEDIKQQTTWNDAAEGINSNFANVDIEIEKLKNVTTRDKGYYQTVESLIAAHPTASAGSRAFVGYVSPYAVYAWVNSTSRWVDTGETVADGTLDLGNYYTKIEVDNSILVIKGELGAKFGSLYVDPNTGLMSAFASDKDKQEWLETGNPNLILAQVNVGVGGDGKASWGESTTESAELIIEGSGTKAVSLDGHTHDASEVNGLDARIDSLKSSDTAIKGQISGVMASIGDLYNKVQDVDEGGVKKTDLKTLTVNVNGELIVTTDGRSGTSIKSTNQECILLTYAYDGEYYRWYLAYFG